MFSAHIDINDPAIADAIRDVISSSPTNWVVCGYVPREAKLKVVATGTTDVNDMLYELSDGKIYYCFLKYEMSETFKYVFISWCGEGVTGQTKALFANHCRDFEDYLKKNNFAFAAQINARNENDLQESEIVKALNKTSTFIRARTTQERRAQPQQSLMEKRTNYWNKEQQTEQQRKTELEQHRKANEAMFQRNREEEMTRLSNQSNAIQQQQESWRQQRTNEWKQRNESNARVWDARLEQQRAALYTNAEAPDRQGAANPQTWGQRSAEREEVPRAQGFSKFNNAAMQQQQQQQQFPPQPAMRPAPVQPAPANNGGYGAQQGGYDQPADNGYGAQQDGYDQPADDGYGAQQGGYDQPADNSYGAQQGGYDQPADDGYDAHQGGYDQPADNNYGAQQDGYDQPADDGYGAQGSYGGQRQVRAISDFEGEQEGDLRFYSGDIINLIDDSDPDGWWRGELNGVEGVFPMNFVEPV